MPRNDERHVGLHDEPQDERRYDDARKNDETHLGYVPYGQRYAHEYGLDVNDAHGNGQNAPDGNEDGTNASSTNDNEPNVVDDVNST